VQRLRQARGRDPVFERAVEPAAVHRPQFARDPGIGALIGGQRLQAVIEPNEIERRADPRNTGNEVQPAHQQ
jgi:hypothetical protein